MASVIFTTPTFAYLVNVQVFSLIANNASNNNTLVDELQVLLPSFGGSQARVRCFAHILNLVVKVRVDSLVHLVLGTKSFLTGHPISI